MFGYIYKTTNRINNKIYVGQKKSPVFLGDHYLGSGKRLWCAIHKYGRENFHVEQIDTADTFEDLNQKEIFWISELNSMNPEIGYNLIEGGSGVRGITAWNKGLTKDTDSRLCQSSDTIKKRSDSLKKAYAENRRSKTTGGWICRARTPEMNKANSERQIGKRLMILVVDGEIKSCKTVEASEIDSYIEKGYTFGRRPYINKNPLKGKSKESCEALKHLSDVAKNRIATYGHQGCCGLTGKDHPRSTYKLAVSIANEEFRRYWEENGQESTRKHYNISRNTYKYCCEILNIVETPEHRLYIRRKGRRNKSSKTV